MKFDQLRHFQETSRYQHIGMASKSLNISAGAISHSIKCLEIELGQKLFYKNGKRIFLTTQGQRLLLHVDEILRRIDLANEDLRSESLSWSGNFRVGVTHTLLETVFVPAWSAFQEHHPDLIIEASSLRSGQIAELVQKGELDIGICFNPLENPAIKMEVLVERDLLISFRRAHPITRFSQAQQLASLQDYTCASPKSSAGIEICENHPELKRFKIEQKIDFIFDSYETAIARIEKTNSWCLLPDFLAEKHSLASLRPRGWAAKFKICAIWNVKKGLPGALQDFLYSRNGSQWIQS